MSCIINIEPDRKEYLARLVSAIRKQIREDPHEIKMREICEDEGSVSDKWVNVVLLCMSVEKYILGADAPKQP